MPINTMSTISIRTCFRGMARSPTLMSMRMPGYDTTMLIFLTFITGTATATAIVTVRFPQSCGRD